MCVCVYVNVCACAFVCVCVFQFFLLLFTADDRIGILQSVSESSLQTLPSPAARRSNKRAICATFYTGIDGSIGCLANTETKQLHLEASLITAC